MSLGGKVKHPQQLDLNALQRLPTDQVTVSYQAGHGVEEASFTGVPLWTLLAEAGGIDDPANRAELRHVIRITARDGYVVVLSPGEIAPDFGAKQAHLAYRRTDEAPAAAGFRLVMPGDKRFSTNRASHGYRERLVWGMKSGSRSQGRVAIADFQADSW